MTPSYNDIFSWLTQNAPASAQTASKHSAALRGVLDDMAALLQAELMQAAAARDFERVEQMNSYCSELVLLSDELKTIFSALPAAEPTKPTELPEPTRPAEPIRLPKPAKRVPKPTVSNAKYDDDPARSHGMDETFAGTKICAFELCGEITETDSWQDAVVKLCALMAQRNPEILRSFVTDSRFAGKKLKAFLIDPSEQPRPERAHLIPGTDVYVFTNFSADNLVSLMRKILRAYKLPDIRIYLRED